MADGGFGLKIGVEGEREFKKSLAEINQTFKVLGSEMKLVQSQFDKNDNSVEALTARNATLNKQIDNQKEKNAQLSDCDNYYATETLYRLIINGQEHLLINAGSRAAQYRFTTLCRATVCFPHVPLRDAVMTYLRLPPTRSTTCPSSKSKSSAAVLCRPAPSASR